MSSVPYTFANAVGNIALSQLDANFSNVKALVDSANIVTDAAQPVITSVGTLTTLTVAGAVVVNTGPIKGSSNINILTGSASGYTQIQWAEDVNAPNVGQNQYIWVDADGAFIETKDTGYDNLWQFTNTGNTVLPGNANVAGNVSVTGSLRVLGITKIGVYNRVPLRLITGQVGSIVSVIDSPVHAGKLAYWDATFARWSYVKDDSAV